MQEYQAEVVVLPMSPGGRPRRPRRVSPHVAGFVVLSAAVSLTRDRGAPVLLRSCSFAVLGKAGPDFLQTDQPAKSGRSGGNLRSLRRFVVPSAAASITRGRGALSYSVSRSRTQRC